MFFQFSTDIQWRIKNIPPCSPISDIPSFPKDVCCCCVCQKILKRQETVFDFNFSIFVFELTNMSQFELLVINIGDVYLT